MGAEELIESTIRGIANSIDKGKLEKWAADCKNGSMFSVAALKRDLAFETIKNSKASSSAAVNGLLGLIPGVFSIPVEVGKIAANWATKAQVAYTIACLYDKKPSANEFAADLYPMLAGPDLFKEATKEIASETGEYLAVDASPKAVRTAFNNAKVQQKLIKKLGEKMVKKTAGVGAAFGKAVGKLVSPLLAFKDGIDASADIKATAIFAQSYYLNEFPNPEGTYVTGSFGAALRFGSGGSVSVHPRLFDINNLVKGDIKQGVTIGTGKYVRNGNSLTITFGKVSWKESQWNAPCPTHNTSPDWAYEPVERELSNKTVKCNIIGEARINNFYVPLAFANGGWDRMI
jgi:hypothetical protein